jgi:hypothetical protein
MSEVKIMPIRETLPDERVLTDGLQYRIWDPSKFLDRNNVIVFAAQCKKKYPRRENRLGVHLRVRKTVKFT